MGASKLTILHGCKYKVGAGTGRCSWSVIRSIKKSNWTWDQVRTRVFKMHEVWNTLGSANIIHEARSTVVINESTPGVEKFRFQPIEWPRR